MENIFGGIYYTSKEEIFRDINTYEVKVRHCIGNFYFGVKQRAYFPILHFNRGLKVQKKMKFPCLAPFLLSFLNNPFVLYSLAKIS
jgi:hypothetical protein